jgi:hypothetical protein
MTLLATACARQPEVARHTVQEYRADAALRQAELALCDNNPGTLGETPDCINAREAARREATRSLRELPPIKLPQERKPYDGTNDTGDDRPAAPSPD